MIGKLIRPIAVGIFMLFMVGAVLPACATYSSEDSSPSNAWAPAKGDWASFRNNNCRTGVTDASASMKLAYYKWSFKTSGTRISSSPSVADVDLDGYPEVLIGGEDARLYCLNASSGKVKWRFQTQGPIQSSPAIGDINYDGNLEIVVGSNDGRIYAIAGKTGTQLWKYATRAAVFASPAIADINGDNKSEIVAAGLDTMVYALNGDGTRFWTASTTVIGDRENEGIYASPTIGDIFGDGKMKVLIVCDAAIYIYNGANGSLNWSEPYFYGQKIISTPAMGDMNGDGKLEFAILEDNSVWVVGIKQGTFGTQAPGGGNLVSSPAICDGDGDGFYEIYFGTTYGYIACMHCNDSYGPSLYPHLQWANTNFTGSIQSSPAVADLDGDGKLELVIGNDNRRVIALNAEDGTLSWIYILPKGVFSSPAVADGDLDGKAEIYVGCNDGSVYALDYNF
jgi:outer membrane protein assembly factor BamB